MSDPLDAFLQGLRGQQPPTPFAPASAVRRRGRQRANRQAVSIGVAVFAVTGLGAGGVVAALGEPEPPPVTPGGTTAPAPVPSPTMTAIPESWLLTAGDLEGTNWEESTGEFLDGAWYFTGAEPWCPEYRIEDRPPMGARVDAQIVGWGRQLVDPPVTARVDQLVELFQVGGGAALVREVRAFTELCGREPSPGDQIAPTDYVIQDADFAGDESLLIQVTNYQFDENDQIVMSEDSPHHVLVVRVGDAVTTIRLLNFPDDVYTVAQRAAARLG